MPFIKPTIMLVLLLGLGGCASWFTSDFVDPQVHLVRVEVIKAKLLEQRFTLRFRVDNPNDDDLHIRRLVYDLHLNGVRLAEGESDRRWNVPAHSSREFDVPLRTNLWRHLKKLVKSLEDPEQPIRYQLRGEVKTGMLFGPSVHLRREGEIIPRDFILE